MNIYIVINNNPFFSPSATANRWRSLIKGLIDLNVNVTLFIFGGFTSRNEQINWYDCQSKFGVSFKYILHFKNTNTWIQRLYIYILEPILRPLAILKLLKNLKKQEKGVIWTDSSMLSFVFSTIIKKRTSQHKLFIEMSEFLDIHKFNKGNFIQSLKADSKQKYFEKKAFYAYDGMALMTKTLLSHYQSFPGKKPEFLHLPMTVDLERFNSDIDVHPEFAKPYIVFVGVMNDAKDGVSILIRAFSQLADDFPDYKVYLVGGWNYDTPAHLKLISDLKLEGRVVWKGEFNRNQIPAILKNAALLTLPRPDSKQAQGGFPTKLGEYLATGNPVCATKVGEIPDYLVDGESVFFAEPGSVESFTNAMRRVLSNTVEAKKVGANGRTVAESQFNKDVQAKKLYDFLLHLNESNDIADQNYNEL